MGSTRVLKNSKSRDGAAVEAEGFCAAGCEVLIIVSTARAANRLFFTGTSIHSHGQGHCRTTITLIAKPRLNSLIKHPVTTTLWARRERMCLAAGLDKHSRCRAREHRRVYPGSTL